MTTEPLVLVVDDDEEIRKALERALRLEGFAVRVADGGRRALELVEQERPGVMVLDVVMPDLSGISVVSRLRARGDETPDLHPLRARRGRGPRRRPRGRARTTTS